MKQIIFIFNLIITIICCIILSLKLFSCEHESKTIPSASTNPLAADSAKEQLKLKQSVDPYFIETKDTFSTTGPQSITRNVLQDKNGYFWLASWEGIIRFNGGHFTNFTLKEALIHFHVFSLLEDKTGNLWFGTIRGGVYRYDGKSFTLFTTNDGLISNFIECIMEDKDGNIWFGTDAGVSRYNGKTFTNFTKQNGLSDDFVHSITQDKTGNIWFATHGGVSCYDGKSQPAGQAAFTDFKNNEGQMFSNVRSIIEDKKGNIWIGSENGLARYDGKSLINIRSNFTGYIFEDKTGNLWLSEGKVNGHGMALTKYNGKLFTEVDSSSQIFGISEDRTGIIWYGTENGVRFYQNNPSPFLYPESITPLSFINTFKVKSNSKYGIESMYDHFPDDWVKKEDIDTLIKLIKSKDPCYCFKNPYSSYAPNDKATVGGYAIEFIDSYRLKRKLSFGLWNCPKTDKKRVNEIIKWWEKEKLK